MTPRRVLIVDDEEDVRIIAQLAIALQTDWEAQVAASGPEALEMCKTWEPDALLLDVMMPGMDGTETLRRFKADPATAHIPVVFLTAKVDRSTMSSVDASDAEAVLIKPFDPMGLAGQVAKALGWSMAEAKR